MTKFEPSNHIANLIDDPYYKSLITLRNIVATAIDNFFQTQGIPKVDLYMVTNSVSSPMGRGSDSEPWPIMMGDTKTHLVDSAQFGMEPLVQKHFKAVYCYLPSFRGEHPDSHHLNQFYHCEAELRGTLDDCIRVVEQLMIDILSATSKAKLNTLINPKRLVRIHEIAAQPIGRVSFDEAAQVLGDSQQYIEKTAYGRKITRGGEQKLSKILFNDSCLFWITHFDRDVVPFYQKPDPEDNSAVLNADLILPYIDGQGFAGEAVGAGQRQDSVEELEESMERQKVANPTSYSWYLEMRKRPGYQVTSGFGLGVERLISWLVGTNDIASAAIYPVMKDVKALY